MIPIAKKNAYAVQSIFTKMMTNPILQNLGLREIYGTTYPIRVDTDGSHIVELGSVFDVWCLTTGEVFLMFQSTHASYSLPRVPVLTPVTSASFQEALLYVGSLKALRTLAEQYMTPEPPSFSLDELGLTFEKNDDDESEK